MAQKGFNHFTQAAEALEKGVAELVAGTASDLQTNVRKQIKGAGLYKKGFLHNSVYKKTKDGSDFIGGDKSLPEIGDQPDDSHAYVAVGAVYGAIQNYGGRGIPPHPYWEPAADETRQNMSERAKQLAIEIEQAVRK